MRSVNGGKSWQNTSLEDETLTQTVSVAPDGTVLVGGTGVWISNDGVDFDSSNAGITATSITGVAINDPQGTLYVTTATQCLFAGEGAFANSWVALDEGLPCELNVGDVAVHPEDDQTLWVASGGSLRKSVDGGKTFPHKSLAGLAPMRILTSAVDPDHLIVACSNNGVFASLDGGDNWTDVTGGLPFMIQDLSRGGTDKLTLWAGVNEAGHVYRSLTGGDQWQAVGQSLPGIVRRVTVNPEDGDHAVAWVNNVDIYTTLDGGETWTPADFPPLEVKELAFMPGQPNLVAVGTSAGFFVSVDGGFTWTALNGGLLNTQFRRIVPFDAGLTIYGGTIGGGLYRLTL